MPFTFDDCADPMLRVPAMQASVAASLLTVGMLAAAEDASGGAVWRAICDWGWVEEGIAERRLLRIRRIGLKARGQRGDGSLMVGVALEGSYWRIACDGVAEAERPGMAAMLLHLASALREPRLARALSFRATRITASDWAARSPARRPLAGLGQPAGACPLPPVLRATL